MVEGENIHEKGVMLGKMLCEAIDFSATNYHVVLRSKLKLEEVGFDQIKETEPWVLEKGGKYYFTRNDSCLVAFSIGKKWNPVNGNIKIIGVHTDSPSIKLAPNTLKKEFGYLQTNVQLYGGGLWYTWFDRDLTLAGKVIVKKEGSEIPEVKLVNLKQPIAKIPHLAIHFTRCFDKFEYNLEKQLKPIIGLEQPDCEGGAKCDCGKQHHSQMMCMLGDELGIDCRNILDFDLSFVDTMPSNLIGMKKEFVSAPRMDNQVSCHIGIEAFTELFKTPDYQKEDSDLSFFIMFDNEEVSTSIGSVSMQGANSNLVPDVTKRVHRASLTERDEGIDADELYRACIRRSFLISADLAHVIHPNYPEKHQEAHRVKFNEGIIIKVNSSMKYISDPISINIMKRCCPDVPYQTFIVRNDSLCGSTVGPCLAALTGIKGTDVGIGQLGMHSIRETAGVDDLYYYKKLFVDFWRNYSKTDPAELLSH